MQKLAESSGTVVYESNHVVTIARKPAQWTTTFLFVSGLIAVITLANGIIQFVINHGNVSAAIILLGIGLLSLGISIGVIRYRKKINTKPLDQLETICVFDLNSGKLLDSTKRMVADLSQVNLQRKMQLTSSSRSLVVNFPGGSILLVQGSPFSGGVSAVENTLIGCGIRKI